MTLKYDKLLKHIREKDGEVRSFLDEAELETAVGNYVGELVFVEPDKIFVRDGYDWNLVGGSGNPFDFLQLKTDYTPTGLETVGTTYWDNGFQGVQPDGVPKEFATKEYVDDAAFISSLLFG